jgi:carbon-monoxide dehydrogenase large subunit
VLHGSTAYVTEGIGSHASRSTVMGGSAILLAARDFKAKLVAAAAQRLGVAPESVEIGDGTVTARGGKSLAFAEFSGMAAEATFRNSRRTYAYGAHAAEIAVDPRTGAVQVIDYVAVEDVGRIINPLTLHGQAVGAIVQGLGGALLEDLVYDGEGQLLTGNFADYLMPTAEDVPAIKAFTLESRPSPVNPLGAKGAGEGGIVPVGGIIANAVASALRSLGIEPRELPLSPQRVWGLIAEAK